ncbi:unnamed protein product [Urochloa humidicola]
MATAQAASASPTHHRASAGTSPPPQPPYPSAARIADSDCFPQYTASLKCMRSRAQTRPNPQSGRWPPPFPPLFDHFRLSRLEANQDKSKCQRQFDDYKECKKKEREARLERNKSRSLFG